MAALLKTNMLKVCIDANVYISAIAFGGKSNKVIELALDKKFDLITSSAILNEVMRNLVKKLEFSEAEVQEFLDELVQISSMYEPSGKIQLIPHPKDTLVLETAILGNANVLVTGDKKDLLPLKLFNGIIIEPPAAFLLRLEVLDI